MSSDQEFTVILTGITLLFTMMTVIVGLIWRNGNNAGKQAVEFKNLASDVASLINALDAHIAWHMGRNKP